MNWFTVSWLSWIVAFFVIEGVAIFNDFKDREKHLSKKQQVLRTLSRHTRRWFRTDTHIGRTVWIWVSGAFAAWFIVHIAVTGSI